MSTSPDGIYEPGIVDPGTPSRQSTLPYWLTEPSNIDNLQSPWLDTADVVVIGSGITSASITRTLLSLRPDLRIVVVEARSLCSGATGRNGGHCKAQSPGEWWSRKHKYGVVEALQIMEYEHAHLDALMQVQKEFDIECDFAVVEGLDVYHDEKTWQTAASAIEDIRALKPGLGARYTLYTAREDLDARDLGPHVIGAIGMKAGSLWPYKLVSGIFSALLKRHAGLAMQMQTTVNAVVEDTNDFATVQTSRGNINARHIVHATNGWIGHLLPELRPFISPVKAHVLRQVPHRAKEQMNRTLWLRYSDLEYDYILQRPDKSYITGRAFAGRKATADDSTVDFNVYIHLRGALPLCFDTGPMSVTHAWSGPVAFTQDGNPFLGRIPGRAHQWVCGGYAGIGMVRAFQCGSALANQILGEHGQMNVPRSMVLTQTRLEKLRVSVKEIVESARRAELISLPAHTANL